MTRDEIRQCLTAFDGKATSILTECAVRFREREDYLAALTGLSADDARFVSSGATWLIKHELENGMHMPPEQADDLARSLNNVTAWDAQLHLCQSVRMMRLPQGVLSLWRDWLGPLMDHKRPFLRAWALDALCYLAELDESLKDEAREHLERMRDDPAASVRARVRNLEKSYAKRT